MFARNNLNGIRTSLRSRIHSLPPSHRSPHLERHLLAKEKSRLEQEIARLECRCRQCQQRVADIDAQIAVTCEDAMHSEGPSPAANDERAARRFSRMAIDY